MVGDVVDHGDREAVETLRRMLPLMLRARSFRAPAYGGEWRVRSIRLRRELVSGARGSRQAISSAWLPSGQQPAWGQQQGNDQVPRAGRRSLPSAAEHAGQRSCQSQGIAVLEGLTRRSSGYA